MTWSEDTSYACACGLQVRATRVRWVDAEANPGLRDQIDEHGPVQGQCPRCGETARARTSWLEIYPTRKRATLVLGPHQRADLVAELIAHLQRAQQRGEQFESWILSPQWRFLGDTDGARARQHHRTEGNSGPHTPGAEVPTPMAGGDPWAASKSQESVRDAWVCELALEGDTITLEVTLADAERKLWGQGALRARPIHLDALGMPLIGARVVVSYLGQVAVIDGIVDPSTTVASEIFASLARDFRLQMVVREAERGRVVMRREVAGAGLERNAALCLESARQMLLEREIEDSHENDYQRARTQLAALDRKARLAPASRSLAAGAFQHLAMPSEILRALDELEAVSQRDNLRHLLEVDGLPVEEYEAIRKRVLKAAFDFGLCAPSRFWRRAVDSGIANSLEEYATALVRRRVELEASDDDDLTLEQAARAWRDLGELVEKKQLVLPTEAASLLRAHRGTDATAGNRHPSEAAALAPRSGEVSRSGTMPNRSPLPESEPVRTRITPRKAQGTAGSSAENRSSGASVSEKVVSEKTASSTRSAGVPVAVESQPTPARGLAATPPVPGATAKSSTSGRSAAAWPSLGAKESGLGPIPKAKQSGAEGLAAPAASVSSKSSPTLVSERAADSSAGLPQSSEAGLSSTIPGAIHGAQPSSATKSAVTALQPKSLSTEARDQALRWAFAAWDQGSQADLLALLPAMAPYARAMVPRLMFKLVAPQPASRLTAALLLGCARDPASIAPLCARVFRESSDAWLDMARALSFGGDRAVEELCAAFGDAHSLEHSERMHRLTAALAELAVVESPEGERAKEAIHRLRNGPDTDFALAGARAFARIDDTREARRVRLARTEPGEGADFARQAASALARHTLGTGAPALIN